METCLAHIGSAPYWQIRGKVCYHHHENPEYVIHNHIPLRPMDYHNNYFHVTNIKKPLYAMSHYTIDELRAISMQLGITPNGTKLKIYNVIYGYMYAG
jgi:hypothetical protein